MFSPRLNEIRLKRILWYRIEKVLLAIVSVIKRLSWILLFSRRFDVVVANREVLPFFTPLFERLLTCFNRRFIIDFDDAIFTNPTYGSDWRDRFNRRENFKRVISLAAFTIAGNAYLRDYAQRHSTNVTVIPTCIDVNRYQLRNYNQTHEVITIGWIGRSTTLPSFLTLRNVFRDLGSKYSFRILLVGDESILSTAVAGVEVVHKLFDHGSEAEELSQMDIGVMPLIDSPWERGKCGFKLLQYMAVGAAAVASPIGVNKDIIEDGTNGFFATTEEEWYARLEVLINDPTLRETMGRAGRATVEERYSVQRWSCHLANIIAQVSAKR